MFVKPRFVTTPSIPIQLFLELSLRERFLAHMASLFLIFYMDYGTALAKPSVALSEGVHIRPAGK